MNFSLFDRTYNMKTSQLPGGLDPWDTYPRPGVVRFVTATVPGPNNGKPAIWSMLGRRHMETVCGRPPEVMHLWADNQYGGHVRPVSSDDDGDDLTPDPRAGGWSLYLRHHLLAIRDQDDRYWTVLQSVAERIQRKRHPEFWGSSDRPLQVARRALRGCHESVACRLSVLIAGQFLTDALTSGFEGRLRELISHYGEPPGRLVLSSRGYRRALSAGPDVNVSWI